MKRIGLLGLSLFWLHLSCTELFLSVVEAVISRDYQHRVELWCRGVSAQH